MRNWCLYISKEADGNSFYIGKSYQKKIGYGYQGSGAIISRMIKGGVKFNTEILATFSSEQDCLDMEYELINEFIDSPYNINLALGGFRSVESNNVGEKNGMTDLCSVDVFDIRKFAKSKP